jgi:hypothetical protein
MKRLVILVLTFCLLAGCASMPVAEDRLPLEMQRTTAVLQSVNSKIFGDVWRPGKSMADFTLDRYHEMLATYKSDRALELREILESYDTQVLRGYDNTFVFCIHSSKLKFAMCDDARCAGVERKGRADSPAILETWGKELPLADCPQH